MRSLKIFARFEKSSNYRDGGKKRNFDYFFFFLCGGQRESFDEQEGGWGDGGWRGRRGGVAVLRRSGVSFSYLCAGIVLQQFP